MRKTKVRIIAIIAAGAFALGIYDIRMPEFRVYKTFSCSGPDYREADLHVIVYKPWHRDATVGRIVSQHCKMNGIPNRLEVRLYHSKYDVDHGQEFYKTVFEYGEDEVTDPPKACQTIAMTGSCS